MRTAGHTRRSGRPPVWDLLCATRCGEVAAGHLDGEPLCLECLELVIDRFEAIAADRENVFRLPDLFFARPTVRGKL